MAVLQKILNFLFVLFILGPKSTAKNSVQLS